MNLWCTITTEFAASKITSAYLYYNRLYKSHVFCIHFYKNFLPTKLIKKCFHKELDGNLSVRAAIVCTVANFLYTSMKAYVMQTKNLPFIALLTIYLPVGKFIQHFDQFIDEPASL